MTSKILDGSPSGRLGTPVSPFFPKPHNGIERELNGHRKGRGERLPVKA